MMMEDDDDDDDSSLLVNANEPGLQAALQPKEKGSSSSSSPMREQRPKSFLRSSLLIAGVQFWRNKINLQINLFEGESVLSE